MFVDVVLLCQYTNTHGTVHALKRDPHTFSPHMHSPPTYILPPHTHTHTHHRIMCTPLSTRMVMCEGWTFAFSWVTQKLVPLSMVCCCFYYGVSMYIYVDIHTCITPHISHTCITHTNPTHHHPPHPPPPRSQGILHHPPALHHGQGRQQRSTGHIPYCAGPHRPRGWNAGCSCIG